MPCDVTVNGEAREKEMARGIVYFIRHIHQIKAIQFAFIINAGSCCAPAWPVNWV